MLGRRRDRDEPTRAGSGAGCWSERDPTLRWAWAGDSRRHSCSNASPQSCQGAARAALSVWLRGRAACLKDDVSVPALNVLPPLSRNPSALAGKEFLQHVETERNPSPSTALPPAWARPTSSHGAAAGCPESPGHSPLPTALPALAVVPPGLAESPQLCDPAGVCMGGPGCLPAAVPLSAAGHILGSRQPSVLPHEPGRDAHSQGRGKMGKMLLLRPCTHCGWDWPLPLLSAPARGCESSWGAPNRVQPPR